MYKTFLLCELNSCTILLHKRVLPVPAPPDKIILFSEPIMKSSKTATWSFSNSINSLLLFIISLALKLLNTMSLLKTCAAHLIS